LFQVAYFARDACRTPSFFVWSHQTIEVLDDEPLRRVRVSPGLYVWFRSAITAAPITLGDLITPDKALLVSDLVSSGNFVLVKQGMGDEDPSHGAARVAAAIQICHRKILS
jgi:hypothetical protein